MQPWHAIVWTRVYYLTWMTSSGGRDPVFQNTQLWAHWEFLINNSSKKGCGGTSLIIYFSNPRFLAARIYTWLDFQGPALSQRPPRRWINSSPTAPSPPHPRASSNTWAKTWILSALRMPAGFGRERSPPGPNWYRDAVKRNVLAPHIYTAVRWLSLDFHSYYLLRASELSCH